MRSKNFVIGFTASTLVILALCGIATRAAAQTETILYSFGGGYAGRNPGASLIFDSSGNLYGTTFGGGVHKVGTVFELTPSAGGGWTQKVLHAFNKGGDGYNPMASLTFDASGNLWGTTTVGGAYDAGTIFELIPLAGGGWKEEVVHSFNPGIGDGANPYSNVIFDSAGNLFGTTAYGGISTGTVYEMIRQSDGGWVEKVIHIFVPALGYDGYWPFSGLVVDGAGNLWGTASNGGLNGCGSVFEMTPKPGGGWRETQQISFNTNSLESDGQAPLYGNMVLDAVGNFYGTTTDGGAYEYEGGVAFEVSPLGDRMYSETVINSFGSSPTDGAYPTSEMVFDASGNLYGTTEFTGDRSEGGGTVFELSPAGGGGWTEQVLHTFSLTGGDGYNPYASVIVDASGNVYGTTYDGGAYGGGTVFEITP